MPFASAFNVKRHLRKILNATTERSNVVDGDVELENPTDDADGGMDWGDDADDGELDDDVPELRPRRRPSSVSEEDEGAEKEREDFLCGLVADNETICAEEGPADMMFDYEPSDRQRLSNICSIEAFPGFANNHRSKRYYWMDHMHRYSSGLPFGGLKANAWETVNPRIRASSEETMLSFGDAKLMFNIMDHALNCSGEQRQNFLDLACDLSSRISTNHASVATFAESLDGEQRQHFDSFLDTLTPEQRDGLFPKSKSNNIRIPSDTKTANAMLLEDAIRCLITSQWRMCTSSAITRWYHSAVCWTISLPRAFQSDMSRMSMESQTPIPSTDAFSAFHTYCVAIGRESLDHTPVIDYFLGQLDVIRRGKLRYSGATGHIITTAFGFMVWGSDRIERDSLLKTSQLGTFGQRQLVGSFGQGSRPYFGDSACPDCCRWDYLSPSPAARTNPLPVRYPTKAASDSPSPPEDRTIHETYVTAKRIQFGWLVRVQKVESRAFGYVLDLATKVNKDAKDGSKSQQVYQERMASPQYQVVLLDPGIVPASRQKYPAYWLKSIEVREASAQVAVDSMCKAVAAAISASRSLPEMHALLDKKYQELKTFPASSPTPPRLPPAMDPPAPAQQAADGQGLAAKISAAIPHDEAAPSQIAPHVHDARNPRASTGNPCASDASAAPVVPAPKRTMIADLPIARIAITERSTSAAATPADAEGARARCRVPAKGACDHRAESLHCDTTRTYFSAAAMKKYGCDRCSKCNTLIPLRK
ncbi:hypothetical protein ACHAXT_004035 [Thalassiosira profunda]